MHDIHQVEDQGDNMAKYAPIHKNNTTPFLKKSRDGNPITAGNSLGMNLELYDQ
jgi:hypothetical protein